MKEILNFPIKEAYAEMVGNGLTVTLHYPATREEFNERRLTRDMPGLLEHGIRCLEALQRGERVRIGTEQFPSRPASGSILDILNDGSFYTHRRDGGTRVHPWYHGIASGFPSTKRELVDVDTLQRREAAEEHIFTDGDGYICILPDSVSEETTKARLGYLGLGNGTIKLRKEDIEYLAGNDELVVLDNNGAEISRVRGNIYLSWEQEANVAIAKIRQWNIEPEHVEGFDAEGMLKDGRFIHFNREMFYFTRKQLDGLRFGDELVEPDVYVLKRLKIGIDTFGFSSSRVGKKKNDGVEIPDIFKPDDGLRRVLDALGIEGYKGRWIKHELEQSGIALQALGR